MKLQQKECLEKTGIGDYHGQFDGASQKRFRGNQENAEENVRIPSSRTETDGTFRLWKLNQLQDTG